MEKKVYIKLIERIIKSQANLKNGTEQDNEILRLIIQEELSHLDKYIQTNLTNLMVNFLYVNQSSVSDLIEYLEHEINDPHDESVFIRESEAGFDEKYGTETGLIKEQFELQEIISMDRYINSVMYSPSPIDATYTALDFLCEIGVDYRKTTFIDAGSGMGRCLLLASDYPFSRIIGVEISSHLSDIAANNIKIYKGEHQKCKKIETVCIDILEFELPKENTVIFYFYEPFSEMVFYKFHEKLSKIIKNTKQEIILIFLGKVFLTLETSEVFKLEKRINPQIRRIGKKDASSVEIDNYTDDDYFFLTFYKTK